MLLIGLVEIVIFCLHKLHSWQANQIHVPQGNSAATAFLLDMKKKRKEKAAL